jgi:general secretion pathway protein G
MKLNRHVIDRTALRATCGFTLVEMLLVLTIIGILAALVYPNVARRGPEARVKATRVQIAAFKNALGLFEVENGYLPTGSSGLEALLQSSEDTEGAHGPYLDKIPKDPWGNDYIYQCPGKHKPTSFDLMSLGPDGQAGTADDITNWE